MAAINSILKTKFIARKGPGRGGINIQVSSRTPSKNNRIWTDIDGTRRSINHSMVTEKTADYTLKAVDSGQQININSTTTTTITLPAPAEGLHFRVFNKAAASGGAGHTITCPAGSKVYAKGITAADAKGLINTQATGAIGDAVDLRCDGTDWFAILTGTWARVA